MKKIDNRRICIVCEGFEELDYMNSLINKAVFSDKYKFVLINSKSINNIPDIYISKYQSNSYDLVLAFWGEISYLPSSKARHMKIKNLLIFSFSFFLYLLSYSVDKLVK